MILLNNKAHRKMSFLFYNLFTPGFSGSCITRGGLFASLTRPPVLILPGRPPDARYRLRRPDENPSESVRRRLMAAQHKCCGSASIDFIKQQSSSKDELFVYLFTFARRAPPSPCSLTRSFRYRSRYPSGSGRVQCVCLRRSRTWSWRPRRGP